MTPFAQRYFKQLLLPPRELDKRDPWGCLRLDWTGLRCFDISPIVRSITDSLEARKSITQITSEFPKDLDLPSKSVWFEWETYTDGSRTTLCVREHEPGVWIMGRVGLRTLTGAPVCGILRPDGPGEGEWEMSDLTSFPGNREARWDENMAWNSSLIFLTFLDILDTPRITNFEARRPHRGFQRKIEKVSNIGPLQDWHQITINPHEVRSTGKSGSSGSKCLHFVRSHRRRLSSGEVTRVRAHWRGDISLGVSRANYLVKG